MKQNIRAKPVAQLIEEAASSNSRTLDLSRSGLTSVPESLGQLSGLQVLYLSDNQLTSVPESLSQLSGLQTLLLSRNQLTSVPESPQSTERAAGALPF